MALTQTDVDRLATAIASEELEVRVDGTLTKYRSIAELKEAYQFAVGQVAAAQAVSTPSVRYFRFAGSRD
ncbi:MAG: hypothetical protein YHS30scaffold667_30 [Phage 65_10]|nr:MAG: hypothetical protein YHS30scaffold667_30 [Phage 65_10]